MKRSRAMIFWGYGVLAAVGLIGTRSTGQKQQGNRQSAAVVAETELPDSPGTLLAASTSFGESSSDSITMHRMRRLFRRETSNRPPCWCRRASIIAWLSRMKRLARSLASTRSSSRIISRATVGEVVGTAWSAGWSQWRQSRPHYGQGTEAFEKRLGALAIKQTSQSFFTYGVYAAAFHDDPRYYVMGPTEKPVKRAIWSAERTVFTQKDDGSACDQLAEAGGHRDLHRADNGVLSGG